MKQNWLVTVSKDTKIELIDEALEKLGSERSESNPIPLGDDELAIIVRGPMDLPKKIDSDSVIKAVYPNSDLTSFNQD